MIETITKFTLFIQGNEEKTLEFKNITDEQFDGAYDELNQYADKLLEGDSNWEEIISSTVGYRVLFNRKDGISLCHLIRVEEYAVDYLDVNGNPLKFKSWYKGASGIEYQVLKSTFFFNRDIYLRYLSPSIHGGTYLDIVNPTPKDIESFGLMPIKK